MVEDTTYTSVYWKNHAMYFMPLTQWEGSVNDPKDSLERDTSMYAGAIVVQTARPIPGLEKRSVTHWPASIPILPSLSSRPSSSRSMTSSPRNA